MTKTNKNKTLAFLIDGVSNSVVQAKGTNLQYNLLGRGYRWGHATSPGGSVPSDQFCDLSLTKCWCLFVCLDTKLLRWGVYMKREEAIKYAYYVVNLNDTGLTEAFETIDNPPAPPPDYVEIKGVNGGSARVYPDGSILIVDDQGTAKAAMNEAVIKGIAKQLGILPSREGLPVVVFSYPKSDFPHNSTSRMVMVTRKDKDYLQGFEIEDIKNPDGKFKKFLVSKIRGNVDLISFIQT